jgi:hypothetical protein
VNATYSQLQNGDEYCRTVPSHLPVRRDVRLLGPIRFFILFEYSGEVAHVGTLFREAKSAVRDGLQRSAKHQRDGRHHKVSDPEDEIGACVPDLGVQGVAEDKERPSQDQETTAVARIKPKTGHRRPAVKNTLRRNAKNTPSPSAMRAGGAASHKTYRM